jgi:NADP-dependent aldehyde dehydrogenase
MTHDTSLDQVDQIATRALAAFAEVRSTPGSTRATWLERVADELDANVDELVTIADEETALGRARLTGEVARTTTQLRMFAAVIREGAYLEAIIDHAAPDATPPRPDLRRMLRPLGPVAVFSASNFPFAFSVAGGDTASALAAGCPVVVKAHSGHPRLSERTAGIVGEALVAAGAPEGTFALIEGREAGLALVDHPAITAVGFTGSVAGGRALYDRAAARPAPIPFFGELGSINPVVVTPAADARRGDQLAAGLAGSFQLGAGQFCTKPGVVFVPRDSRLAASIGEHVGDSGARLLTPAIADGFAGGMHDLLAVEGVTLLAGSPADDPASAHAAVLATDTTTLLAHSDELLVEVFGPLTLLVGYDDPATLPAVLARLEGSLTATLHAEPDEDVSGVLEVLQERAGRVLFAGWPTGVAVTWSQHHGGPWPATTSQHTSVGATAIRRFLRPIAYQDAPEALLPAALRESNPLGIPRRVDGCLIPAP